VLLACFTTALSAAALAQTYPAKPVRVIIPWPPGGGADIVGRALAQRLSEHFRQQFVVDNRPGASGNVGTEVAARSPADGYTLLVIGANHATNTHLYSRLAFDPVKDFAPVSLLTGAPNILVVHPSLPARSVKEVLALARARPGQMSYGSAGNGTTGHLAMELLRMHAGVQMTHVPYKGGSQFLTDLVGGQVSLGFENVLSSSPLIRSGRLRGLASTGSKRSPALPDIPTVAESGVPGFEVVLWQGLLVPAGTPRAIVDQLHAATVASLQTPQLRERFAQLNVEAIGSTPEEFAAYLRNDLEKWGKVIRAIGVRLD